MIQQKSAFIRAVGELLSRHNPRPLALFGRDETDSYVPVVQPEDLSEQFAPFVWRLVPPGSIFSTYAGWVACRILSLDADNIWVGMEAVVPHPTRGVYVEASYGLFSSENAVSCLTQLRALPFGRQRDPDGSVVGLIGVPFDPHRHPTAPTLDAFLDSSADDLRGGKSVNTRVPSLGTSEPAGGGKRPWGVGRYAVAGGAMLLAAGFAVALSVWGCRRQ
jgi:hypothetical protein